jgi:hypothetical protein
MKWTLNKIENEIISTREFSLSSEKKININVHKKGPNTHSACAGLP